VDEYLYAGSAPYYAVGRMPYPHRLAEMLRDHLGLDGHGRLLDVGCGPGSLTLLLAPLFAETVGIDADPDMIAHAAQRAARAQGVTWRQLRAEDLPADLGRFRVVTFAQSFHWMDQHRVARAVRPMIAPGGAWVHVGATTHQGVPGDQPLPYPRPPHDEIQVLVGSYLGPVRRAGRSLLTAGTPHGEEQVMLATGYHGPVRLSVEGGQLHERTEEQVVASVFSLSSAAPHLFGHRLADFEQDLRALLRRTSPQARFAEQTRDIALTVWRP
jgi:SAM-dependent methyltransferase